MSTEAWLDRTEYPFAPHYAEVGGGRMHYVDEGAGPAVVLVHGTPTWSFLWRRLIAELSTTHRVIAPDHIGFGLSDKPAGWSYRPADHARNLSTLLERLDVGPMTLVVHDFGGPIGLSHAIEHPERVTSLVLFNTFLWSMRDNPTAVRASRLFGSAFGRFLYTRLNLSPRWLIPMSFADRSRLTPAIHRHYTAPFPDADSRMGAWTLAKELVESSEWYDALWARRDRLATIPAQLHWGMKDPAFGPDALARWETVFERAEVHRHDAGHFVQEEVEGIGGVVRTFIEVHQRERQRAR